MGAVLVALLAAALFTGAGAAAATNIGWGDTVFLYQNVTPSTGHLGTWSTDDGKNSVTFVESPVTNHAYFVAGESFVNGGKYFSPSGIPSQFVYVTIPDVRYVAESNGIAVGTTYNGVVNVTATSLSDAIEVTSLIVTYPNGTVFEKNPKTTGSQYFELSNLPDGEYTIQAKFNNTEFISVVTPAAYKKAAATYTFNALDGSKVSVSANVETVIEKGSIAVTVTGMPKTPYDVTLTKFTLASNGEATITGGTNEEYVLTLGANGKATIYLKATEDGTGKIKVETQTGYATPSDDEITIVITKGAITAKTDKESYYIGNNIILSGTSTAGENLYFYIEGTNKPFVALPGVSTPKTVKTNGEWEVTVSGSYFKTGYDAGTYTVYITNAIPVDGTSSPDRDGLKDVAYTTAALVLKQPFISVTDAPTVAVKNTDYIVTGTAEAAENVYVYIFGTNFFATGYKDIVSKQITGTGKLGEVTIDKDEFTIELNIPDSREQMAGGQYFMVIQHPMYNGEFEIKPVGENITLFNATDKSVKEVLFKVDLRQTANAAQALCDALDTQNIDDLYVKLSFVVASGSGTINPIPSEITQGSKLTVSGQTNVGEGKVVTVEMLSTAFAAIPKESVGSASFIALTTTTDADGNWEVTFDTTGLDIDEYTVSVAVESLDTTTAKINVIEGAPTEQPTENPTEQPTQTEQPTEAPSTPGFGALAALAGLGAVAVLLLRRE